MIMELHPEFETLFLLTNSQWGDEEKAAAVKELDALGMDGQSFYARNFRVVEKYFAAFQKNMVDSPGAALLRGMDVILLGLYAEIFWRRPDWFAAISAAEDGEVAAEVGSALREITEHPEGMVTALETLGFSADTKWQVMLLSQSPKKQLETIAAAVSENLPAYEKAREKVKVELTGLLNHARSLFSDPDKTRLMQICHEVTIGVPIVPTFAVPMVVMALENVVFYGLLTDKAAGNSAEFTREELVVGAKALSEKSKLEILMVLKETSLYNLEIAEKVGLTPATVSHHMNTLLLTGFVEVEKKGGKAYFRLAPKGIQRFLEGANQVLL
ncbi:MAG: winged helix-turn-helix domain-containing protein [Gracilibacteraceae bacterium]|jgi:DNA-binding transcriptional ArsR family regulator|nr:winged helix-turn-helix domain-containing protein [Gracilibacteraceae bacterium]